MSENEGKMQGKYPTSGERDSNIELLRIITMLLIISHHYVVNSGLIAIDGPIYSNAISWRSLFLLILGAWGKIGINCFVMITGYFMCMSNITIRKFAKLLFEILFYRLVILVIFYCVGYQKFSIKEIIIEMIPIKSINTEFTSAFLLFFMLIPYLNILIKHLKEKQHVMLLIWAGFTYIFLGTVPGFSITMNYVSWFCVVFFTASYFRLYPKRILEKTVIWGTLTGILVILDVVSVVFCTWYGNQLGRRIAYSFVSDSNTFLAFMTGVCVFLFFKSCKIKCNRLINSVAATTFGVLLIHANSDTMRQWLWKDFIDCVGHYDAPLMPLYAIGCIITIFIICSMIDMFRILLIETTFFRIWDRYWGSFYKRYKKVENIFLLMFGIKE